MLRFGLCCLFHEEPIKFRTTTAKFTGKLTAAEQDRKISDLCLHNAKSLLEAIRFCNQKSIGAFRVNSRILPLKTHPELGYKIEQLSAGAEIVKLFRECGREAARLNVRLSFHPDQFTLLSSPDLEITRKAILELSYQAEVAEWIGADVINIHGGGAYGDKASALKRVGEAVEKLDDAIRKRLTFENDDRVYTPSDLLPLCQKYGIPLVYDVHHHRCLPDGVSIDKITIEALSTWNREPLFHISSPKEGWDNTHPGKHHDFININDFPECWKKLNVTIDIEAKAKEIAVIRMIKEL